MVNVDRPPHQLLAEFVGEDLHVAGEDHQVDLVFGHEVENPLVNAIEIVKTPTGTTTPTTGGLLSRSFDGATVGAAQTLSTDTDWNAVRAPVLIGSKLYYMRPDPGKNGQPVPDQQRRPILLKRDVIATGEQLTDATSNINTQEGQPQVNVKLDSRGGQSMFNATKDNVGKRMAVVYISKKQLAQGEHAGLLAEHFEVSADEAVGDLGEPLKVDVVGHREAAAVDPEDLEPPGRAGGVDGDLTVEAARPS